MVLFVYLQYTQNKKFMNYPFYLKLINPRSRNRLPLTYEHKELGKLISLLSDGSVKKTSKGGGSAEFYSSSIVLNGSATKAEFGRGDLPFKFDGLSFDEALKYDDMKFIHFLAQHPNVKCDIDELLMVEVGKPGATSTVKADKGSCVAYFELVVPEYEVKRKVSSVRQRSIICNHFLSLSSDDIAKTCWTFEVDPRHKTDDEIIDLMIGDNGVLFQSVIDNGKEVKNADVYIRKFVDGNILDNSDMGRVFAIKQAMELSKLEQQPFEYREGNFYHGDTYLGGNFDQLQAFFANNERLYQALVGQRFEDSSQSKRATKGRRGASAKAAEE